MTINILQILRYTPQQYEMIKLDMYFIYCELYTANNSQLQSTVANAALAAWYMQEWSRLEDEFLKDVNDFDVANIDTEALRDYFDEIICKIGGVYSEVLLNKALKTSITPQLN